MIQPTERGYMISRRKFLRNVSAATAYTAVSLRSSVSYAEPLGLPLGLQLYSVREQLAKDYEGTLAQVGSAGYREVEAAGFYQRSAADVKHAMQKANLRCVSAHFPFADLHARYDEILTYSKELGLEYLICSSPGFKTPASGSGSDRGRVLTLDDWRWNAEQFNLMGAKAAAAGIHFGYHNHVHEFAAVDGVVPYMELLRLTDPSKVTLELDCGWATVAGTSPVNLLRDYPQRFSMLHVKDFKAGAGSDAHEPTVTELGLGSIDYRPIFRQCAKTQQIKHMFVEQEAFDMPYLQSLKVDADYMRGLKL
jgi:sugar phosphate isomerase/epimerase